MSILRNIIRAQLQNSTSLRYTGQLRRSFFTGRPNQASSHLKAFKEKQAKMQCDDGYPVYLKGGSKDKILMHITMGGAAIGLLNGLWVIFQLALRP